VDIKSILNNNYFTVLWSGGKDSTACLLWVLENVEHNNWNVLYVEITGNTHPLCTQYVLATAEKLGISNKLVIERTRDFFELMDRWGPPLLFYRWCLYQLKRNAFKKSYKIQVCGIRKSDSKVRKKVSIFDFLNNKYTINPIIDWNKEQVTDFIKDHGIEINPCYKLYGHSGNCMFCPYHDKKSIILTMNDDCWRNKILSSLIKNKEKCIKGKIGREIFERWTKYAKQKTLVV
jgi:3'-phosphoadenosine 5'-phosphosulfate sulfotransferase (PAPS reductase)/FAD synthetase